MPEKTIFLIGPEPSSLRELLAAQGYQVRCFSSSQAALAALPEADLLILGRDHRELFEELTRAARGIPKLVVSADGSTRKLGPWLRQPLAFPVHEPSDKDILAYAARLLKEHAQMERAEQMRSSMTTMKEELAFFEQMNRVLTSSRDINEALCTIMRRVKDLTGAEAWSVLLADESSGDLVFEKTVGKMKRKIKKFRLKPGEGIAGWVAQKGVPAVVSDITKDPRFSKRVDRISHVNTRTVMSAPIVSQGKVLGVLELINKKKGDAFTERDLEILMKFVNQAALAVEKIALQQKLEELAITDDLTNLFNTRYLNRSIENEIQRSNRYNTSVSIIFMDIDHFKDINDTHGHLVGSKVLVEIGELLITELRSVDIVARYGGDEFVIVLPQTTLHNALAIAERIRKSVESGVFLVDGGYNLTITASFGVASYPESSRSKEELMRLADESMYNVKHRTRNGVYAII
ncbi:MAG: diguanylate cyclase [Nitrospirota bacterium]|jgi:diguanylate cyclase (GGDEF)-like protein